MDFSKVATNTSKSLTNSKYYTTGDRSNYILGISFANSDDFMGGISNGIERGEFSYLRCDEVLRL